MQEKLHWVQLKGFSPECVNTCALRLLAVVQEKLHCLQRKGFSPPWTSMCLFSLEALMAKKSHWLQLWEFFPWCWSMCVMRSLVILKERLHRTHKQGFSAVGIHISRACDAQSISEQSWGINWRQQKLFTKCSCLKRWKWCDCFLQKLSYFSYTNQSLHFWRESKPWKAKIITLC